MLLQFTSVALQLLLRRLPYNYDVRARFAHDWLRCCRRYAEMIGCPWRAGVKTDLRPSILPSSHIPLENLKLRPTLPATTPKLLRNSPKLPQKHQKVSISLLHYSVLLPSLLVAPFLALFTVLHDSQLSEAATLFHHHHT